MTPERIIQIADQYERRHMPEFHSTPCNRRRAYLSDRLNHACFIRICAQLRAEGREIPSIRKLREKARTTNALINQASPP